MAHFQRAELDGVPIYWADCPTGPLTASLGFRVGRVDEELRFAGITHLVEHLVMSTLGMPEYEHNAVVEDKRTLFYATGSAEDVIAFLHAVVDGLTHLPIDRIAHERKILRAEDDRLDPGITELLRGLRFGPVGHGVIATHQLGLESLEPGHVTEWANTRFTAQNAALWLTGPIPDGLRLALPSGEPFPIPEPRAIEWLRLPAFFAGPPGGVAISIVGARWGGLSAAIAIAERRLQRRLRHERGLVYYIQADSDPLTRDVAEAVIAPSVHRTMYPTYGIRSCESSTTSVAPDRRTRSSSRTVSGSAERSVIRLHVPAGSTSRSSITFWARLFVNRPTCSPLTSS